MATKKGKKTVKKKEEKISFVNVDSSINSNVKDDYEVFEIEKDGKEKKIIQPLKSEAEKPVSKEQIKGENKILRNAVLIMVGAIVLFSVFYAVMYFSKNIEYRGVRFELDDKTLIGKTLYRTSVPVIHQGSDATYSFWLRNDPRVLANKVPVDGEIIFKDKLILNVTTEDLFCDGNWNLAIGNLLKLSVFGTEVIAWNKSGNYTPAQDYMFVTINEGVRTEINKIENYKFEVVGKKVWGEIQPEIQKVEISSYEINIANCEVLPAAERLLLEAFVRYSEIAKAYKEKNQ